MHLKLTKAAVLIRQNREWRKLYDAAPDLHCRFSIQTAPASSFPPVAVGQKRAVLFAKDFFDVVRVITG